MVVHAGGKASSFKNREEKDSYDADGVSLYHVKGTNPRNTRAVQVAEEAASLNSGDCFVLLTPGTMFAWHGSGSNEAERATADGVAALMQGGRELATLAEGDEPEEFWAALGGKGEYADHRALAAAPREARLFCLSNTSGEFSAEEVCGFTQDDLCDDDCMMLDTYTSLFMWVGSSSNTEEQELGLELCVKYIKYSQDGRDPESPIVVIRAGSEPPMFTCHFLAWDADAAGAFVDPYQARLAAMRKEQAAANAAAGAGVAPRRAAGQAAREHAHRHVHGLERGGARRARLVRRRGQREALAPGALGLGQRGPARAGPGQEGELPRRRGVRGAVRDEQGQVLCSTEMETAKPEEKARALLSSERSQHRPAFVLDHDHDHDHAGDHVASHQQKAAAAAAAPQSNHRNVPGSLREPSVMLY